MLRENKSFGYGVIHGGEEGIVVIFHVQHADWLFMRAGLRPGDGFKEFIPGAETAGQGDVALRPCMSGAISMRVRPV